MVAAIKASLDIVIGCGACSGKAFVVVDGVLIIEHRHHSEKHVTRIPLSAILDKVQGDVSE